MNNSLYNTTAQVGCRDRYVGTKKACRTNRGVDMQKDGSPLNLVYWIRERYPAPVMVYAGVVYMLCSAIGHRLLGQPVPFNTIHTVVGIVVAVSTFLLIRTLDEHSVR